MPHDKNGALLQNGDEVILRGTIQQIAVGEEYCNAQVALAPMPPYTDPYVITINTRQTEKSVGVGGGVPNDTVANT